MFRRLPIALCCALPLCAAPAAQAASRGAGSLRRASGIVLAVQRARHAIRLVGPRKTVTAYGYTGGAAGRLRPGTRVTLAVSGHRVSRVETTGHAARISFYGRVVRVAPGTTVVALADRRTFTLLGRASAPRVAGAAHSASGPTVGETVLAEVDADTIRGDGGSKDAGSYFVSPAGSDSTGDGSVGAPFRSIGKALSVSYGGETVRVAPGDYPSFKDQTPTRTAYVTVKADGGAPTVHSGSSDSKHADPWGTGDSLSAHLYGSRFLRFEGLHFLGTVSVDSAWWDHAGSPSEHVEFSGDEFQTTNPGPSCLIITDGAQDVSVAGSHLHDCGSGIASGHSATSTCDASGRFYAGPPAVSRAAQNITIVHNVIEKITQEGIAFGDWSHVLIDSNQIHDVKPQDPNAHYDGIQFYGNSEHVVISNNVIHDTGLLILIQNEISQPTSSADCLNPPQAPLDDIVIANNLLYNAGSYAINSEGANNTRIVANTIWNTGLPGITIRHGFRGAPDAGAPSQGVVVMDNITSGIATYDGVNYITHDYNVIGHPSGGYQLTLPIEAHETVCEASLPGCPGLTDPANADYHLGASVAFSAGTSRYLNPTTGQTETVPASDLEGGLRADPPSIGAYVGGSTPPPPPSPPISPRPPAAARSSTGPSTRSA